MADIQTLKSDLERKSLELDAQLAELKALKAEMGRPVGGGITAEQMAHLLDGTRKAQDPNNRRHPGISVFSYPEGDLARAKPRLDRETFFCGHREDEEQLTPAEIDLYNTLTDSKQTRGGDWWVRVSPRRREIFVPNKDLDQRMTIPNGLSLILLELRDGTDYVDPLYLTRELEKQQSRILELEQRLAGAER